MIEDLTDNFTSTVEVRGAFKQYQKGNGNIILNRLNMTVPKGAIYGLMGASGCGKTTLLSCIIGMIELDGGEIRTLGKKVSPNVIPEIGQRIGYMPQELALVGELTIKETVYYFGNIFRMNIDELRERYEMLHKLLELPDGDKRVENCSGGQMRRISFAAAMIHEPDLLILDEPTVGLDPILREKIWDFMVNITRESKLSIIITTHYIEEAKQADCVGLMRNGIILAEDSPINIMNNYQVGNLEEAFLKLCINRGNSEDAVLENNINKDKSFEMLPLDNRIDLNKKSCSSENAKNGKGTFRRQIIKALMVKNLLQFKRSLFTTSLLTVLPVFQMIIFIFSIARNPTGLRIGIIDEEIKSYDDCKNVTFIHKYDDDRCELNLISCRMLDEITDDIATKVFYSTFDEAYQEVKRGKIIGFIHFTSNFTESTNAVNENSLDVIDEIRESSYIKVYMDQSDLQLTTFIQWKLYDAYKNYSRNILNECNLPNKLDTIPMNFFKPIHGVNYDFFRPMFSAFSLITMFFAPTYIAIGGIITERTEGLWNRTLLAGVSTIEMITSQIIICAIILLIQILETFGMLIYMFYGQFLGSLITIFFLITQIGICGLFFGVLMACACNTFNEAIIITMAIFLPMTILSGTIWPTEGFPFALKIVANLLPTNVSIASFKNIFMKGFSFTHPSILFGFGVIFIWILLTIILGLFTLDKKKFSRNT